MFFFWSGDKKKIIFEFLLKSRVHAHSYTKHTRREFPVHLISGEAGIDARLEAGLYTEFFLN